MKIKVIDKSFSEVMALPQPPHMKPKRTSRLLRLVIKALSATNLARNHIKYIENGMDKLPKGTPYLLLMNHSSFIDMQIAANYLFPKPFATVTSVDAFVGKTTLLRYVGCIPTQKYVPDLTLIKDISYTLNKLGTTVLMYPEASYSIDGRATTLPDTLGKLLKLLKVPVVTMITHGAYSREPLYNMLRHRDVDISVDVTYLLSPEQIAASSPDELNAKIREEFSFDSFAWQKENNIVIDEDFRAEGLERLLYKCPHCKTEGKMESGGTTIRCTECGKEYELTELGELEARDGVTEFSHIPDWYAWEREEVEREIDEGVYSLDTPVDIMMLVDYRAVYRVGEGRLCHSKDGFNLTGCDGELEYSQSPIFSYSLWIDYFWYELGDMIAIGNKRHLFVCIPKGEKKPIVAKARMATEILYKKAMADKRSK